jgi:hypothetical protein
MAALEHFSIQIYRLMAFDIKKLGLIQNKYSAERMRLHLEINLIFQ